MEEIFIIYSILYLNIDTSLFLFDLIIIKILSKFKLIRFTNFILGSFFGLPIPPIILGASRMAKLLA